MPRINVVPTEITRAGVYPAGAVGQADGHSFPNNGEEFVEVVNANATLARTVTFVTPAQREGLAVADLTVSVPAASRRMIGPFPTGYFNHQSGADRGKVHVNYEAGGEADLTIRVFRFPGA